MPMQALQENWIVLVIALVVALLVVLWLFAASRRTKVQVERTAESEGPARRNQALIDAAPAAGAAGIPVHTPEGLGGAAAPATAAIVPPEPAPEAPTPLAPAPAPAPTPAPAPAAAPAPAPAPADTSELTRIKGLGPKLAAQLSQLGVTRLEQIAAWDDAEIDRIDAQLGRFQGRIRRDDWPGQARLLAAGDTAGYEAKFGKI